MKTKTKNSNLTILTAIQLYNDCGGYTTHCECLKWKQQQKFFNSHRYTVIQYNYSGLHPYAMETVKLALTATSASEYAVRTVTVVKYES